MHGPESSDMKNWVEAVSSVMERGQKQIPSSLASTSRCIDKHWTRYKAAEWKAWLLLYASLLFEKLQEPYRKTFVTGAHI